MRSIAARLSRATLMLSAAVGAATASPTPAGAWGSSGHQYVGNLAWQLLNPVARQHVAALLGPRVSLGEAAAWADCIRSVDGTPPNLSYAPDKFTPKVCDVFGNDNAEKARMVDYARRNWTQCEYNGQHRKCHQAYHFADVNVHNRTTYRLGVEGTGAQDLVQALNAAIAVLACPAGQTCQTSGPFNILDQREAVFLLAHFTGDVHQPLHVGAIYLDSANAAGGDDGRPTAGGNLLLQSPGDKGSNLHHEWDTIVKGLGETPKAAAVAAGCALLAAPNAALPNPRSWANHSIALARTAYSGMSFTGDTAVHNMWDIRFTDRTAYIRTMRSTQASQLIVAGAHLADTLNAIWPSTERPAACSSHP